MKPYTYSLIAAALACGFAQAVETAYTTPVGYITATIAGNAAANPSGAATYVSASLVQPTEFASAATSSPSGTTSVTFSGGVPTGLDGKYMLEITNGTQEGWWTTVVSSTATTVTVSDTFPTGLAADVQISIKKFSTVKSVFGSNSPGLNAFDGGTTQADEIQFLNPLTGVVQTVVYLPEAISGSPDMWFDFVGGGSADDFIVYPGSAVRVVRYGATGLSLVSSGTVKTTKTQVDIFSTENWLGVPLAAGGSLGSMQFFSQLVKFDAGTTPNDFLDVLAANQVATSYVALAEELGGGYMMDFVSGLDSSATVLPEGTGFVLKRDPSQAATILTIPAQTISN